VSQQGVPRSFYDVFPDTPFTGRIRAIHLNYLGGAIAPFNSYLVLLGIETLSERISKSVKSAEKIVEFLENRPEVAWVNHAHAKNSKYRALAAKYLPKGAGAILSFGLKKKDRASIIKFLEAVKVFSFQANIGDARSLIINPSTTTHIELPEHAQELADIHTETIRLSIGLEDVNDLIADLEQAFAAIQ
jgi:O-acetylhomoserine (thiol)-lyase